MPNLPLNVEDPRQWDGRDNYEARGKDVYMTRQGRGVKREHDLAHGTVPNEWIRPSE